MTPQSAFVLSSPPVSFLNAWKYPLSSQPIPKRRRTSLPYTKISTSYGARQHILYTTNSRTTPNAVQSEESSITSQEQSEKKPIENGPSRFSSSDESTSKHSPYTFDERSQSNGKSENTSDNSTEQDINETNEDSSLVQLSIGPLKTKIPARWLLYSVPFMWGSFGPAVRLLFAQQPHQDPSIFNSERLLLSTCFYVPILMTEFNAYRNRSNETTTKTEETSEDRFSFFPAGIELGVYVFLANIAQVIGLQQTSASRAAFLVQLQTVIVPVLSGVLGLDKISPRTWISSIIAVAGVALLSSDKGHGTEASLFGDSLEVLSAIFFSTYIIRLSKYCNTVAANPLVATKISMQAILSIGWAVSAGLFSNVSHESAQVMNETSQTVPWTLTTIGISIAVVVWTGLMSSAISGWAQTRGQQGVPPSEAVVIFATQPLWASALAAGVLGERFGARGFGGGALIIAATLLSSLKGNNKEEEPEKRDA